MIERYLTTDDTPGLRRKMEDLVRLAVVSRSDPSVIRAARSAVLDAPAKDRQAEAAALYRWVREHIRYTRDPLGVDTFHHARHTIAQGAGDCDDMAITLSAMLGAIGIPSRFVVISTSAAQPDRWRHIYVEALIGPGRWFALDATEPYGPGWAPPSAVRTLYFPVPNQAAAIDAQFHGLGLGAADPFAWVDPTALYQYEPTGEVVAGWDIPAFLQSRGLSGLDGLDGGFFHVIKKIGQAIGHGGKALIKPIAAVNKAILPKFVYRTEAGAVHLAGHINGKIFHYTLEKPLHEVGRAWTQIENFQIGGIPVGMIAISIATAIATGGAGAALALKLGVDAARFASIVSKVKLALQIKRGITAVSTIKTMLAAPDGQELAHAVAVDVASVSSKTPAPRSLWHMTTAQKLRLKRQTQAILQQTTQPPPVTLPSGVSRLTPLVRAAMAKKAAQTSPTKAYVAPLFYKPQRTGLQLQAGIRPAAPPVLKVPAKTITDFQAKQAAVAKFNATPHTTPAPIFTDTRSKTTPAPAAPRTVVAAVVPVPTAPAPVAAPVVRGPTAPAPVAAPVVVSSSVVQAPSPFVATNMPVPVDTTLPTTLPLHPSGVASVAPLLLAAGAAYALVS